jgi:hypothetical protein
MNRLFVVEVSDVQKLAAGIFSADASAGTGRATYLRSLLAVTQSELAGKPIQRLSGRPKRPELDTAAQAFEKVNEAFYPAVLAAVPEGLTPAERQSKTSFARSAAATLRRAIKTGWNPLGVAAGAVTKGELTAWIKAHSVPRPPSPGAAEKRVVRLADRIAGILKGLPQEDASRIRAMALEELEGPPQRLTNVSVRRQESRPAAH